MGNLRAYLALALLSLAACGDDGGNATPDAAVDAPPDSKIWNDAPPPMFDLSCVGNAAPTTATANITLSGSVQQLYLNGLNPAIRALGGAELEVCLAGSDCNGENSKGTATSASNGSWSIGPFTTSSLPVDAYVAMTASGSRPTNVYPASPFTADQGSIPVLTFTPQIITALGALNICTQNDGTNGLVGLAVTDCADSPISDSTNLTLTVKQGGNDVTGTTVVDLGDLDPQAAGTFIICNVPANATTTVGATYMSTAFRSHDVAVIAGSTTTTLIRPGY